MYPVIFRLGADTRNVVRVISIGSTVESAEGGPTPPPITASAKITPTPKAGSYTLTVGAPETAPGEVPDQVNKLVTLTVPHVGGLGGAGFVIEDVSYGKGGAVYHVADIDKIPVDADHVIAYKAGQPTLPADFRLDVTAQDSTGTVTTSFYFGALPDYSPGRDALSSAVAAIG